MFDFSTPHVWLLLLPPRPMFANRSIDGDYHQCMYQYHHVCTPIVIKLLSSFFKYGMLYTVQLVHWHLSLHHPLSLTFLLRTSSAAKMIPLQRTKGSPSVSLDLFLTAITTALSLTLHFVCHRLISQNRWRVLICVLIIKSFQFVCGTLQMSARTSAS